MCECASVCVCLMLLLWRRGWRKSVCEREKVETSADGDGDEESEQTKKEKKLNYRSGMLTLSSNVPSS